jgi:hypothetical protein
MYLIVSVMVGYLTIVIIFLLVNILQFSFLLSYTGPIILLYTFLSKTFNDYHNFYLPSPDTVIITISILIFLFFLVIRVS